MPNGKDLIVHLARTPHTDQKSSEPQELTNVTDIENSQVAEHALNALRMTVGGFNILGLFVVSEKNIIGDNSSLQKLKTVLMDIKSTLDSNGLLYANTDELDKGDKLLLNYISSHKNFVCKTISSDPSKAVAASPVDWKFMKLPEWQEFETYYDIDTFFPLPHSNNHFDTEKNVMATIDVIAANLNSSLLFFNGEPWEKEDTLEKINKQNKSGACKVKVTVYSQVVSDVSLFTDFAYLNLIFQPKLAKSDEGKLKSSESLAQYTGVISSRIYGSSRNSVAEVESYIRSDIIRSITTRMQIYYDALLANDDGGNDDGTDQDVNNTIPPRRVFFSTDNVSFGDYLFQNETEETTVKQTMDILGINLSTSDVNTKVEAIAQLGSTGQEKSDNVSDSSEENVSLKKASSRLLLIIGALVALLIAIIYQFILK